MCMEWLAILLVYLECVAYLSQSTHVHCVEEILSSLHFHWSSLHPQVSTLYDDPIALTYDPYSRYESWRVNASLVLMILGALVAAM